LFESQCRNSPRYNCVLTVCHNFCEQVCLVGFCECSHITNNVCGKNSIKVNYSVGCNHNMPGRSHLRSAGCLTFDIPQTCTRVGDRAISVAGPRTWNKLPLTFAIRLALSLLRKKLKTHLFDTHIMFGVFLSCFYSLF